MEGKQFHIRTLVVAGILAALLLIFLGVLYNLQVLHGEDYRAASTVKIANVETVEAARGEIVDRYGRSLVGNRATYEITLNTSVMGAEAQRNAILLELIHICQDNGITWTDTLPISADAPFTYTSDSPLVYTDKEGKVQFNYLGALLDELPLGKDILPGRWSQKDLDTASSVEDLGTGLTAEEVIDGLRQYFLIDESLSDADARALIGVLYEVNLRSRDIRQTEYIFAQDVNIDAISGIKEHGLTGVTVSATTVRQYNTTSAAHLLGRVSVIQAENWDNYKDKGYNMNDKVGIGGVEAAFEDYLRGESGTLVQELSTSGKVVSEYWKMDTETGETLEPKPGDNVMLTLDLRLQEKVEEVLASTIENLKSEDTQGGAVVVQSVNDGSVLAMASYPTFDLSTIYQNTEAYNAALNDPLKPFNNRATNGTYPPGSTFKPLVAIAALEEGLVTPTEKIQDTGTFQLPEEDHYPYGDWHPQCWYYRQYGGTHGWENLADALRDSCNIYFFTLGHRLGIDLIDRVRSHEFGLGQTTGLELPEEKGWVAGPATSEALGMEWYGGNLLNAAIGQDNTHGYPPPAGQLYRHPGQRGQSLRAPTCSRPSSPATTPPPSTSMNPELLNTLDLDPDNVEAVKKGMWEVANDPKSSSSDRTSRTCRWRWAPRPAPPRWPPNVEANAVFVLLRPL